MTRSDTEAYWHCLLPEEVAVIAQVVNDREAMTDADWKLLSIMATRMMEERTEQGFMDRRAARVIMQGEADDEDDLEVDENATVTKTDSGYWVQAWMWVDSDDVVEMLQEAENN